jgi:Domain of unknown function (DUF4340)
MTPKSFAALAVIAVVSAVAAIAVYSSSVQWASGNAGGEVMFADLAAKIPDVAKIDVSQAGESLTIARDGETWVLADQDSFPASKETVQALLAGLSRARLVEAKTRKKDRYALLGVEDPAGKDAKSHLVRLVDGKGKVVAEVIVGNKRQDTNGVGQSGTYVRRPEDQQAWLADADLNAGVKLTDWVNTQLFETKRDDVKRVTVSVPGEEPLEIVRSTEKKGHTLAVIPDGMKLKYVNVVDEVVRAASTINFDGVRKRQAPGDDKDMGTVVMDLEGGLTATFHLKEEGDTAWLALDVTGEGATKKVADALKARADGWEFSIPKSQAKEILKRRTDLLEDVSS